MPGRLQNTSSKEKAEKHFPASALQADFLQNTCLYALAGESPTISVFAAITLHSDRGHGLMKGRGLCLPLPMFGLQALVSPALLLSPAHHRDGL